MATQSRSNAARASNARTARRNPGAARKAAARKTAPRRNAARGRSSSARKTATRSPLAVTMLLRDHRLVKQMFREFENVGGNQRKENIALTICKELKVHSAVEEELFYPALAEALGDMDMIGEALVEHSVAKGLIARIEGMKPGDAWYEQSVTVLKELIEHHVEEEEDEMFPKARRSGVDLENLGLWMKQRKKQLRAEHGLPPDESLQLDVRETARLQRLDQEGITTKVISRLAEIAKGVAR